MRYEVWTEGVREGRLLDATNDLNRAVEVKGNNNGSVLVDTENVNMYGAVKKAVGTLKSHERVIVCELKDGNMALVEDMQGS